MEPIGVDAFGSQRDVIERKRDEQARGVGSSVLDAVKVQHPQLPVIVLTAELQDHHRALAESLGVDVFLTKPFSPIELLETVERLLGESPVDEPA